MDGKDDNLQSLGLDIKGMEGMERKIWCNPNIAYETDIKDRFHLYHEYLIWHDKTLNKN